MENQEMNVATATNPTTTSQSEVTNPTVSQYGNNLPPDATDFDPSQYEESVSPLQYENLPPDATDFDPSEYESTPIKENANTQSTEQTKSTEKPSKNQVYLRGNLCDDPQIKYEGEEGKKIVTARIGINNKFLKDGKTIEEASFFEVDAFGEAANYLLNINEKTKLEGKKRAWVEIKGKLKQNRWIDHETGEDRSKIKVSAFNVSEVKENNIQGSSNTISLVGRLANEPKFATTKTGLPAAKVTICFNDKDKNGYNVPNYFTVEAYKDAAEAFKDLKKGAKIRLDGRLKQDRWEKDGQKRSAIKIIPKEVTVLRERKQEQKQEKNQGYER